MSSRLFALLLTISLAPLCLAQDGLYAANRAARRPTADANLTIRKNVGEVRVSFTVTDGNHRPVTWLAAKQVEVIEFGQPVTPLLDFRNDLDLPLELVILMDRSDSVRKYLAAEGRIAKEFTRRVLRPATDRAWVATFDKTLGPPVPLGEDGLPVLPAEDQQGGITALFDVLAECARTCMRPASGLVRHAIILLSDGEDNYSLKTLPKTIEELQRADIAVYSIRTHHSTAGGDEVLQALARHTGGSAFAVSRPEQLTRAFAEIENQLRSHYTVTFRPGVHDGRFHRLQVAVRGAGEVQVLARSGYWAPGD